MPELLANPVKTIGDLNTPLSMVVLGFHLAGAKFGKALSAPWTYMALFLRHAAVPLVLLLVLSFMPGIDPVVRLAALIPAAAPVAAMAAMFSIRYRGEASFASALVAVSTALSIVTMPLAIGLAKALFV